MRKLINNLRQKPEHHKRTVVWISSAVITGVIFVVWLALIRVQFAVHDGEGDTVAQGPLTIIKENVANAYESIQSNLGKIKYQSPD